MALYAIGDVHGRLDTLMHLLENIRFRRSSDQLLFVGDLVNRGPQSIETVEFVRGLGSSAVTVLGNHELYLLASAEGVAEITRSSDDFSAFLNHPRAEAALAWLRRQPLLYADRLRRFVLVHAGIPPQWGIRQARAEARRAEQRLQSPRTRRELLTRVVRAGMVSPPAKGWKTPYCLQSWGLQQEVAAYTLNALTGMRYCSQRGEIPIGSKAEQRAVEQGPVEQAGSGYRPWFERQPPGDLRRSWVLCFGHWAKLNGVYQHPYYGIDTNCGGGNELTVMNMLTKTRQSLACRD